MRPYFSTDNLPPGTTANDSHSVNTLLPDLSPKQLRYIFLLSTIARQAEIAITKETFRDTLIIQPSFQFKCPQCGKENNDLSLTEPPSCKDCGVTMIKPDSHNRTKLEHFQRKINNNSQSLDTILKQGNPDTLIFDDLFYFVNKIYHINQSTKEIIGWKVKEVTYIPQENAEFITDKSLQPGTKLGICILCRNKAYGNDQPYSPIPIDTKDHQTTCPNCDAPLYEAYYVVYDDELGEKYYIEDELLHASYFSPTEAKSLLPPVLTLLNSIKTTVFMDKYEAETFRLQHAPQAFVVFQGISPAKVADLQRKTLDKLKQNPSYIPWIAAVNQTGTGKVEYVSALPNAKDMQSDITYQKHQKNIGSFYGVSPILQNDLSVSGGLNNEGLQLTVTRRTVETLQRHYVEKILRPLTRIQLGITDWEFAFKESDERDTTAYIDRVDKITTLLQKIATTPVEGLKIVVQGDKILEFGGTIQSGYTGAGPAGPIGTQGLPNPQGKNAIENPKPGQSTNTKPSRKPYGPNAFNPDHDDILNTDPKGTGARARSTSTPSLQGGDQ